MQDVRAVTALARVRELVASGIRDDRQAWALVISATNALPQQPQLEALQRTIVDLLQVIEVETILGGDCEEHKVKLSRLLDWIEQRS